MPQKVRIEWAIPSNQPRMKKRGPPPLFPYSQVPSMQLTRTLTRIFLHPRAKLATCYFPNRMVATLDLPCNLTAEASSCCGTGGGCLDNGLCRHEGGDVPGSCTSPDYNNSTDMMICPQPCQGQSSHPLSSNPKVVCRELIEGVLGSKSSQLLMVTAMRIGTSCPATMPPAMTRISAAR